jgi:CubicO group peptidase (beta-lactamase class C family)
LRPLQKIPGLSVAVVTNDAPALVRGFGVANVEHNVEVKPETVFQSGSIGKQFTSFAVMLLVDEGIIRLDAEISSYLGSVPDSWSGITVRHLLTHTGGMTDYDFDFRRDYSEDELLELAKKVPVAFTPGERWQYSNLGYVVLGIMIGKVTGRFYGDFLEERVFGPLGMETARVISDSDIVLNRAAGYHYVNGELKNQEWVSATANSTADGALYFTALDLVKWDAALRDRKLLSEPAYAAMWTPVQLNDGTTYPYGFGWVLKSVNGHRIIEHGGSWQGFMSFISRYPDDGLTVIVLGNVRQMDPARIAHSIAEEAEPALEPSAVSPAGDDEVAEICRAYEEIAAGRLHHDRFTPELAARIEGAQKDHYAWPAEEGPVRRFLLLETEKTPGATVYSLRVEHELITFFVRATRNADGRISVFDLDQD